jgi:hypothetical protein
MKILWWDIVELPESMAGHPLHPRAVGGFITGERNPELSLKKIAPALYHLRVISYK